MVPENLRSIIQVLIALFNFESSCG